MSAPSINPVTFTHGGAQFPVLEMPEGALCESNAICRYIASISDSGLYPVATDPSADIRASIDSWIDWTAELESFASDVAHPLGLGHAGKDPKDVKEVRLAGRARPTCARPCAQRCTVGCGQAPNQRCQLGCQLRGGGGWGSRVLEP